MNFDLALSGCGDAPCFFLANFSVCGKSMWQKDALKPHVCFDLNFPCWNTTLVCVKCLYSYMCFVLSLVTGQGIALILIGLVVRLSVSFTVVLGNHFRWAEMVFIAIAWLPKATVQVRRNLKYFSICV